MTATVHRLGRADDRHIHHRWDATLPPVLTVDPGDEVIVETRSGEDGQLHPGDAPEALDRLDFSRLHALTGPIAMRGARPGDVLEVRILSVEPAPWGLTLQRPGAGLIEGFPNYLRFYRLDRADGMIEFGAGILVPVRPFLGVLGVAPAGGPVSTVPPGSHGGNLDCRDLVAGSTLWLPVQVDGALFSCGDAHAAQGDGEVCVTAVECAATARLGFALQPGGGARGPLREPRAETPDALMTLAAAATVEQAARRALEAMLDLIGERCGLSRADAYALASIAVDLRVNQLVNRPAMGVRAVLPKSVLSGHTGGHGGYPAGDSSATEPT